MRSVGLALPCRHLRTRSYGFALMGLAPMLLASAALRLGHEQSLAGTHHGRLVSPYAPAHVDSGA